MGIKLRIGQSLKQNWRKILIYGLFAMAAFLGVIIGFFMSSLAELPEVSQLQYYKPNIITAIYAEDGTTIQEYAVEKRIVIKYNEIPKHFINGIVATEDVRFFEHSGIDLKGILRAFWKNLWAGKVVQGGSTLTQQLSRNIFISTEQTIKRKIVEALYAIQIEKYYSKEQILELYCNQIYFGQSRYGLAAAADYYFAKKSQELTLEECALLAGLPKAPESYAPDKYPVRALKRRNFVLDRMVEENYITREEAILAKSKPINIQKPNKRDSLAPYFTEDIRKFLSSRYGSQKVYKDGLKVYSTLNLKLQIAAEKALKDGLHVVSKRRGWRGVEGNIFAQDNAGEFDRNSDQKAAKVNIDTYKLEEWQDISFEEGERIRGIVLESKPNSAIIRIKDMKFTIGPKDVEWTKEKNLQKLLKKGDIALFHIDSISDKGEIKISLDQIPEVNGAIIALEAKTGKILALVGGYDFKTSQWNRATQATRQAGSAFKPIVYATAVEQNMTPADRVVDEPSIFMEPGLEEPYQPKNYYKDYQGIVTLRIAIEKSLNIPAVKVNDRIGAKRVVEMAHRMGITNKLEPVLSLALGSCDINPLELTAAFSVFTNSGLYVEPYMIDEITDREGNNLYKHIQVTREVLSPDDAFIMTYVLQGVIQSGTGQRAKILGVPLAGKTGTTDDYTDAWFMGYSPSIICGVWVGLNDKKTLGEKEEGARVALPIWIDFMKTAIQEKPGGDFMVPVGIVFRLIEKRTGLLATPETPQEYVIQEAFKRGNEPVRYVTREDLINIEQPYYLQERDLSIF